MWSTGEGNGTPLQYSCLKNPMNNMKRQKDRIRKEELPRLVGAQYATGDQWRNINNLRYEDDTTLMAESKLKSLLIKVQFSSVAQSCPTFCDPMSRSMTGLPVHHQLLEFTQTHVHRVSDAIQPSHPLPSPSPSAPNPSQHQSLFQ